MIVLSLHRATPLTQEEMERLPLGCVPLHTQDGCIARARVELPLPEVVKLAVSMARAIPDASIACEESQPAPIQPTNQDPWQLIRERQFEQAEQLLNNNALDSQGRDRVRQMWASVDPAAVASGCRIAMKTNWKSAAMNIRSHVGHRDARVRKAVAEALSVLAGPSIVPSLRPLLQDPDPDVQTAAAEALKKLGW